MALRLVFEKGPDAGREFIVKGGGEVRVGRGPGFHIVPRDPAWRGGLRIQSASGVVRVTNEMAGDILRNGNQPFPRGATENLYHEGTIQPTAETLVRAFIVDDPPDQDEPVREVSKQGSGPPIKLVAQWAAALAMLLVAGYIFVLPTGDAPRGTGSPRRDFEASLRALDELRQAAPKHGRDLDALVKRLRDARLHEVKGWPREAFEGYLAVRSEADRLSATAKWPDEQDAKMRVVRDFAADRVFDLNSRNKFRRDGK